MVTTHNTAQDYRKWILFNNSLSDNKSLYDLYSAVHGIKNVGQTRCEHHDENGSTFYLIECASFPEQLKINEKERQQFLDYLKQHYFHTDNIDEWFKGKQGVQDKSVNHTYLPYEAPAFAGPVNVAEIKPHYKESRYYNIKLGVSILGYLAVLTALTFVFLQDAILGVTYVLMFGLILLAMSLLQWIVKGFFVGMIKGNAVRITDKQYPLIFQIVSEQAKQLKLKQIPEIYISHGFFNAFVMKFARTKVLMLYSEVVETAMTGDDSILRFVIGHELGHIKRRHLNNTWLILATMIPFLGKAYSRGCEYTCDRIGYHFSKKGAIEGILILSTGKEIYSKVNIDHFVNDSVNSGSFWMWFSEKFSTHPHTAKRLDEIKKYAQVIGV